MMKHTLLYLTILVSLLLNVSSSYAASAAKSVTEGNRLYDKGEYAEAAEKYEQAKEDSPDSDIASFNLGAALFKKGDYKESIDSFTQALHTENREIEADAAYNIANAKYKLGSGLMNSDLNGAAALYRESLDYYKRAIELNTNNNDAKYNHELVERELKILLDKIKNQPPQEQQNDQQDDKQDQKPDEQQNGEDESRQSQDKPEGDKEEKEQQQAGNEQQQERKEGSQERAENRENDPEQPQGQPEQESKEMSPEEARMLLDAFADEEAMDSAKKMKHGYNREVLKDW